MIKLGSIVFISFFAFTYSAIAQEDGDRVLNIKRAVQKGEGAYRHQLSIGTNLWSVFAWPGLNLDYILNGKYGLTVGAEKQWISDFGVGETPGEGVIATTKEWKGHRINAEVRYYWSEELDHYPEYFIGAYYRYRHSVKNEFSKNTSEYDSTGVYTGNPNDYFTHNAEQFITGHYAGITLGVMYGKIKLGAGIGLPVYFRDVFKESEFHSANPDHPEYTIKNQPNFPFHIKLYINLSIPFLKQGYISFDR
tara:strand:+ start:388 stop:1137 length:750 start_codon:yes stop_codon:yes gene_type:complete